MTSSIHSPSDQWSSNTMENPDVSTSRKRKRRQRTGGAIEDCFTCRSRAILCDRKRPYCTQCIDMGKECSGYRTKLTWGVGVASRGKLRGLSCPVANQAVEGDDADHVENTVPSTKRRRTSSVSTVKREDEANLVQRATPGSHTTQPVSPPLHMSSHHLQHFPTIHETFNAPQVYNHSDTSGPAEIQNAQMYRSTPRPLQRRASQYSGFEAPKPVHPIQSFANLGIQPSSDLPKSSTSLPFYETLSATTSNLYSNPTLPTSSTSDFNIDATSLDSLNQALNDAVGYLQGHQMDHYSRSDYTSQPAANQFGPMTFDQDQILLGNSNSFDSNARQIQQQNTNEETQAASVMDTRFTSAFCHITPRMQSWMDYYDRNICPYLVAFDGSENPYRRHVLHLALGNEGLQNAIAALATNNLRMRKKELRQFGFADEIIDAFRGSPPRDANEPTAEELCYKQLSIDQLNVQLTDRTAAQDDSVLATLLILCLFHVCDSGFSKFKTQLAGVQKLLAFRDPKTQSDFTRWIQMFFTWFDVMTSAVNDREMQVSSHGMAMLDLSSGLGAMEQFSGCDGKLFKLIARLGRLNLLSQGRPVSAGLQAQAPNFVHSTFGQPKRQHSSQAGGMNKPLAPADYANLDGNGWSTPVISSDDEDVVGADNSNTLGLDDRTEFWAEWHEIRSRLQSFQMDTPNITSLTSPNVPNDPTALEAGQRDMIHINESFRCAALLYTERLGHPLRASSHPSFQRLVSEALYHITSLAIDSCVNKFLLWPLFIIGTECIDERHRDIIRKRCVEVQKESGFYNNISSLEVLERVWTEASCNVYRNEADEVRARRRDSEFGRSGRYGQAFRFRKAMDRVDGEYIVV